MQTGLWCIYRIYHDLTICNGPKALKENIFIKKCACGVYFNFKMNKDVMKNFKHKTHNSALRSLLLVLFLNFWAMHYAECKIRDYSPHKGYIQDIHKDDGEIGEEIPLLEKPEKTGPSLKEQIFNSELSREFKTRYEDKFGKTESERIFNSPNKYTYYDDLYTMRGTPEQVSAQRQEFGEYMMRRLVEYHADNIAKNDPQIRPVWEAKEKISQIKVEIDEVKFDARYSFAGNIFDIRAHTNTVEAKSSITFAGSGVFENILSVNKKFTPRFQAEIRYLTVDAKLASILTKSWPKGYVTTLTLSTAVADSTRSPRDTLYLVGAGYLF